jgi:hypothetical protein
MNPPSRLLDVIAPRGAARRRSDPVVRAIHAHLAALALPAFLVLAPTGLSAAPADAEHPGPGEKIVRSTVGAAPQSLTEVERAKLALRPAEPAPASVLRPAPWWPPEWRAQLLNGGARPARIAAAHKDPNPLALRPGAATGGRPAHVTPSATKPPEVRTIGYGARNASQAEIDAKRAAAARRSGGR